jgi:hypothetical protein
MTTSPAPAAFRNSYPLDLGLYNDDQQEVLYITDDPAGHNLHLDISNAAGQTISLSAPASTTASATNYHFALRFRPGTLSSVFQSYLSYAVSTLQGNKPAALSDTLQLFATETVAALQALQQQGWTIGYGQEPGGALALYFLSSQAQKLAPGAKVSVIFPHASAEGTGGARSTRVELNYRQVSLDSNATLISGHRQSQLTIVNQRGQKNIPLHVSFLGANAILNDGKAQNTLTLRITNILKDNVVSLNPAGSSAPSKFVLSFDVQADQEVKDWALGTVSQVRAIHMDPTDPGHWSLTPSSGQEEVPEWILTPQPTKTVLAPNEAVTLTLNNIISSLPPGQTNLYVGYENIPGYWDGQFVVLLEKSPLLYRGNNVGIGTATPHGALEIGPDAINANAWVYFQGNANGAQNPSADIRQGLMLAWNPSAGQGETQLLYATSLGSTPRLDFGRWNGTAKTIDMTLHGGNVGIGTASPNNQLVVAAKASFGGNASNAGAEPIEVQGPGAGVSFYDRTGGATGRWVIYSDRTGAAGTETLRFWSSSDKVTITQAGNLTLSGLSMGGNSLQQGVNWTAAQIHYHSFPDGPIDVAPLTSSNALRIVGGEGGVLATNAGDVMCWASYGIVVKGNIWAENKYFRIDHPAKPDHYLIHACLEGPESSVYYRGRAQLADGRATIRLPDYFESLTRQEGRTVLLTPEGREPFLLSYEPIDDGTFRVYGTRPNGAFSWEVKAVRADVEEVAVEVTKDSAMHRYAQR